jgi:protein-S-isoprenylcysteine O-methyltransferase Ste14
MTRWTLRIVGGFMIFVGIIPLTPLIWLLVFVHTTVPQGWRVPFWVTQTAGMVLVLAGALLLLLAAKIKR